MGSGSVIGSGSPIGSGLLAGPGSPATAGVDRSGRDRRKGVGSVIGRSVGWGAIFRRRLPDRFGVAYWSAVGIGHNTCLLAAENEAQTAILPVRHRRQSDLALQDG